MKSFWSRSIQTKLVTVATVTAMLAFIPAAAALFGNEWFFLRSAAVSNISTLADITAKNSTAALVFGDNAAATRTLEALSSAHHISAACVYDKEGKLFSSFTAKTDLSCPLSPHEGFRVRGTSFELVRQISFENERIGTIYVLSTMIRLYDRLKVYAIILFGMVLGSGALAFLLSSKLQAIVLNPILGLVRTMEEISKRKDYSVRASESEEREIRALVRAFNEMLFQIQERDVSLRNQATTSAFLSETSKALAGSLDYVATLKSVARLVVPILADVCLIDVVDQNKVVKRIVAEHRDPGMEPLLRALQEKFPASWDSGQPAGRVLRSGRPEFLPHLTDDILDSAVYSEEHRDLVRKLGFKSCVALPLIARGQTLGVITLIFVSDERVYREGDTRVAEEVAQRAAVAVDNARLYEEAQIAVRVRDEFLQVASHELKTPLTPLKLSIQRLRRLFRNTPIDEKVDALLETSDRQITRLSGLVENMLDISRITAGKIKPNWEMTDVAKLVRGVIEQFRLQAEDAKCEITLKAESPLPGVLDSLRFEQIVTNLITNAIKYGGGHPIEVSLKASGEFFVLAVQDHGIGIAPPDQERIFGRFERAASSQHFGGLGLGLYISQQIAMALGGSIDLKSQLGEGSLFTLTLPLRLAAPAASEVRSAGLSRVVSRDDSMEDSLSG